MLVLTRRSGEGLLIGDNIKITVEKISKGQIKIGIEAPKEVVKKGKEEEINIYSIKQYKERKHL